MPSSSARCAQLPRPADKLPFYLALRNLRDFLKGRLPRIEEIRLIFKDYSEVKAFANAAENGGRGPAPVSESSKRKRKRGNAAKNEAAAAAAAAAAANAVSVVPAGAIPHGYHHPHARGYGPPSIMPPPVHPALPAPPPPQYPGHMYAAGGHGAMMPRFHPGQQMTGHPLPGISSLGQHSAVMHSAYYQNSMGSMSSMNSMGSSAMLPSQTSSPLMGMSGYGQPGPQTYMATQQPFFPSYQLPGPPTHPMAAAAAVAVSASASDVSLSVGNGSAGSVGAASNFDDLSLSEFLASSPSDSAGTNTNGGGSAMPGMDGMTAGGPASYFTDQPNSEGGSNPPTYTPL